MSYAHGLHGFTVSTVSIYVRTLATLSLQVAVKSAVC